MISVCMQAANCQLLKLETSDAFTSGPTITAAIDNSTCLVAYVSQAQSSTGLVAYNGQSSLTNGSLHLSVFDAAEALDPARSFIMPEILPYTVAGSKVIASNTGV